MAKPFVVVSAKASATDEAIGNKLHAMVMRAECRGGIRRGRGVGIGSAGGGLRGDSSEEGSHKTRCIHERERRRVVLCMICRWVL